MQHHYQTISQPVNDVLFKEKGSKFIGFAFPIFNEAERQEALKSIKETHPKATHHCYAFRLGANGENHRANDDGEPSGSAGLPIYNQLLAHDLTHILLVIVRYYGGTKLGVSGLIKAYKESAKMTLDQAEVVTKELEVQIEIHFKFSQQHLIFSLLHKFDAQITDFLAEEEGKIIARLRLSDQEKISEQLSKIQKVDFNFL